MKRKSQDCKSRLPDNSAVKQQQLPAFRLQLSANEILSGFFATGVFCLGMGVILLLSAKSIREIEINYTEKCASCAKLREDATNFDKECSCSISFYLPQKMEGNVYLYYKLYGFYQNLYRYILSRSNIQLVGTDVKDVRNCAPFKTSDKGLPIAPCGAIANSLFNDTFVLLYNSDSSTQIEVPMMRTATAWWTDKYVKFQNPTYQNLSHAFEGGFLTIELPEKLIHMRAPKTISVSSKILLPTTIEVFGRANISTVFGEEVSPAKGTAKPPNWPKPVYELDEEDPRNNGFINDDFIVWMRTAAFPTFKKLHRRLHRIDNFTEGLPAGSYSFIINYNFPVSRFQGQKALVLSTLTWSGGSSLFLGLAYLVTGAVTLLAFFSMMAVHLKLKERKTFFLQ